MMKNAALLVYACDRYEFLYKGFDYFFRKNWDSTLKIKQYFATEELDLELDGYVNVKSGSGEWSNRLKRVLDQIEEEYIVFFQEDMWLSKKVKEGLLIDLIKFTIENDLDLVKLHSSEVYKTDAEDKEFHGLTLSKVNKKESDFLMSHQVSIWKKSFLYSQLYDNEHPWRNERKGSKRLKKDKSELYQIDFLSENGKEQINNNNDKNAPGEYHTISVNACISENAIPFIKEIKGDYPDYADKLMYHHLNQITHDGKKKPRKEDPIKKLKNKLKEYLKKSHKKTTI